MKSTLFIPSKIKVGFQNRSDTFTGKLAYVIYYDEKGKLRKETSWKSWCNSDIEAVEYDNEPRNNYVINKGGHDATYWGSDRVFIRIHDPREFEFEIKLDNLLGILMHSDVSKRDIVEKCVFAWYGTELVLLPVNSEEYQSSLKYTEKQSSKVSAKNLVPGIIYAQKKSETPLTYVGFYQYWGTEKYHFGKQKDKGKSHVFYDGKEFVVPSPTTLSHAVSDEVSEDYASLVEKYFNSIHAGKIVSTRVENTGLIKIKTYSNNSYEGFKLTGDNKILHVSNIYNYHNGKGYNVPNFIFKEYELVVDGKSNSFTDISETNKAAWEKLHNRTYYAYNHRENFNMHVDTYKNELIAELRRLEPEIYLGGVETGLLQTAFKNLGYGTVYFTNNLGTDYKYKEEY